MLLNRTMIACGTACCLALEAPNRRADSAVYKDCDPESVAEKSKAEEGTTANQHEARDALFGTCELVGNIATQLVQVSDSPATRLRDLNNLRLASTLWNQAITGELSEARQLLFQHPISTTGLPVYPRPESAEIPLPRGNLLLAENYRTNAGLDLAINAWDVKYNPIFKHIIFRFRTQRPGPYPHINDTVNIRLGRGRASPSVWMVVTNQPAIPNIDESDHWHVEVNIRNASPGKFGRAICDQFITQPPVQSLRITFRAETPIFEGYVWCPVVTEPTGVRVWHVLQAFLDALVLEDNTNTELSDLYARSSPQDPKDEPSIDNGLSLPPLPDDSDEDLNEPTDGNSESS
ncbi:uncharacterized protein J3D65DRAFT_670596 [Phyllosticta citribraziliensis]|uniref:Uncharacterized protein n=1 Tax=Phyllosticta citribraziliensis TaxID=989973 RepID=A0ABR1LBB8_9PEZI